MLGKVEEASSLFEAAGLGYNAREGFHSRFSKAWKFFCSRACWARSTPAPTVSNLWETELFHTFKCMEQSFFKASSDCIFSC